MSKLIEGDKTYNIIGACMTVHRKLGAGFLESVYSEALAKELEKRKIPFVKEKKIELFYDGQKMNKYFKACHPEERRISKDRVVRKLDRSFTPFRTEIKSKSCLLKIDEKQTINYLKATKYQLGLLINFGENSLRYKRFINTSDKKVK